jgi:hypothetical protein
MGNKISMLARLKRAGDATTVQTGQPQLVSDATKLLSEKISARLPELADLLVDEMFRHLESRLKLVLSAQASQTENSIQQSEPAESPDLSEFGTDKSQETK